MKKIYLGIICSFLYNFSFAQTITQPAMTDSPTVICGTTYDYYDTGGSFGDYLAGEDSELVVCPDTGSEKIGVTFSFVSIENTWDLLTVYNGSVAGTGSLGIVTAPTTIVSSAANGCLTFTFSTDGTGQLPGWEATLYCAAPICTGPDAPTDFCDNAPLVDLVQAFAGTTDCGYTASDATGSGLDSTGDQDPDCGFSINNSSWLSFIAADSDVSLDWEITGGSDCAPLSPGGSVGVQLSVYEGTCGALTFVGGSGNCLNPTGGPGSSGQFVMSGLTQGNQYYLMIDGYAGDLCDYTITPVSGVAITPDNDDCSTASTLTCGAAAETGDIVIATDIDAPNECPSGSAEQEGIWFTFTGDGSDYTVNTTGSDFETDLNIYYSIDADPANYCTTLVCETAYTGSAMEAEITFTTVNNRVYYLYLDGKSGAVGNYSIAMTCATAPACDAEAGSWN